MITVEGSMEVASGEMARWPVTTDAFGWFICSFNKHLMSSHFVPGIFLDVVDSWKANYSSFYQIKVVSISLTWSVSSSDWLKSLEPPGSALQDLQGWSMKVQKNEGLWSSRYGAVRYGPNFSLSCSICAHYSPCHGLIIGLSPVTFFDQWMLLDMIQAEAQDVFPRWGLPFAFLL